MYRCTECGTVTNHLYRHLNSSVIKISHCDNCSAVVDKYIEYDPTLIFLDALLLKRQAFQHVLSNSNLKSHWRLTVVFLLCDVFTKYSQQAIRGGQINISEASDGTINNSTYPAIEWNIYMLSAWATIELFAHLALVLIFTRIWSLGFASAIKYSNSELMRGMLLSQFGKLLVVPSIIWGQTSSYIYLWLARAFIFASSTQAVRVVTQCSKKAATCIMFLSYALHLWTSQYLENS